MHRFGENVVVWKMSFGHCESLRCQVLFDQKMRKLNHLVAFPNDNGDETRACDAARTESPFLNLFRASPKSSSTIIFTMTSVNIRVAEMFLYISTPLNKSPNTPTTTQIPL